MKIVRLITLAFLTAFLPGCFAMKFKSTDAISASASSNQPALSNVTVAIEKKTDARWLENSILEGLSKRLKSTAIFKDVILTDDLKSLPVAPDMILVKQTENTEPDLFHSCSLGFEGEMITIGTIGIIPQICKKHVVESFLFFVPKNQKELEIKLNYESGNVIGWAAMFYAFSPDWTLSHKKIEDQYLNAIRLAFSTKSADIKNALK